MHKNKLITMILILASLLLATLACNFPSLVPAATPTPRPVAPTLPGKELETITLTEEQINTMIANNIQLQGNSPITDIKVELGDGMILVSGTVNQGDIVLPLELNFTVQADGKGSVDFEITSARLGLIPLPAEIRNQIQSQLNSMLDQEIHRLAQNIYILSITIQNGEINVTGYLP